MDLIKKRTIITVRDVVLDEKRLLRSTISKFKRGFNSDNIEQFFDFDLKSERRKHKKLKKIDKILIEGSKFDLNYEIITGENIKSNKNDVTNFENLDNNQEAVSLNMEENSIEKLKTSVMFQKMTLSLKKKQEKELLTN